MKKQAHIRMVRPGYFIIWIPIVAFAATLTYVSKDPWMFLIAGFWPAVLGWRLTVKFRDTFESDHRPTCSAQADLGAANLRRAPAPEQASDRRSSRP